MGKSNASRTVPPAANGSRNACLAMVFKLTESASRIWRVKNGPRLLPEAISGVELVDREKQEKDAA